MRSITRLAVAAGITLTLCVSAGVVGVVALLNPPSPTTQVTAADGSVVTLDWRDFPASADPDLDPQDVLDAPRAEEVAAVVDAQIEGLSAGLAPVLPGVEWNPADPEAPILFPDEGNGYGGESLHSTYNTSASTRGALPGGADWNTMTDALDAQLSGLGYDDIVWGYERDLYPGETRAQFEEEMVTQFGSTDPDEMWMWSGSARQGSLWVMISIWDEHRGAPEDAWPEETTGIDLLFGGTVISERDEATYAEGVAPFEGLQRPGSTSSD